MLMNIRAKKIQWHADQCKQRMALCHIGLLKDHYGHLVKYLIYHFLPQGVEKQQLEIK